VTRPASKLTTSVTEPFAADTRSSIVANSSLHDRRFSVKPQVPRT
jgi:hypothetical protein